MEKPSGRAVCAYSLTRSVRGWLWVLALLACAVCVFNYFRIEASGRTVGVGESLSSDSKCFRSHGRTIKHWQDMMTADDMTTVRYSGLSSDGNIVVVLVVSSGDSEVRLKLPRAQRIRSEQPGVRKIDARCTRWASGRHQSWPNGRQQSRNWSMPGTRGYWGALGKARSAGVASC